MLFIRWEMLLPIFWWCSWKCSLLFQYFLSETISENAPNTLNNGKASKNNGNAPLRPPQIFVVSQKNLDN